MQQVRLAEILLENYQKEHKIIAITRNIHRKGYILKTQANPGFLELVEINNFNHEKIEALIKNCSICINLIGILFEKRKIILKIFIQTSLTCYLKRHRNTKLKN